MCPFEDDLCGKGRCRYGDPNFWMGLKSPLKTACSMSALWDSLPYSSPSTPDRSGAPLGGERFRGARFDSWAILAFWCTLLQALLGRAIALRLC